MSNYYDSGSLRVIDIIQACELPFEAGNVVKYVLRAGRKPGETAEQAYAKALRYCELAQGPHEDRSLVLDLDHIAQMYNKGPEIADVLRCMIDASGPQYLLAGAQLAKAVLGK